MYNVLYTDINITINLLLGRCDSVSLCTRCVFVHVRNNFAILTPYMVLTKEGFAPICNAFLNSCLSRLLEQTKQWKHWNLNWHTVPVTPKVHGPRRNLSPPDHVRQPRTVPPDHAQSPHVVPPRRVWSPVEIMMYIQVSYDGEPYWNTDSSIGTQILALEQRF